METTKNKPLASPKEDTLVGNGMSKREARKIRMQSMNKSEIAYMRRKRVFDAVWPFFRFFILFGLCFVILYPLIYMISCAFRDSADMSDPTVMWIPRHLTLNVIKETADVMDIWNTLKTTLLLNVGCSLVQVASCALAGYGFARFKFKGKGILFGIVVMMILVPPQIISIPQYMLFRHFGIGSLTVNLINTKLCMYLPAAMGNGIRAGLMIFIFRQFFKGLPKELEDAAYLDGCGPLRRFDDMKAYLEDTMRYTREETLPEGMVLATQFLCIRKSDNRLVGMIQVRHYLNDFLRTFGGHIGYSVRPSERRKGYASWMLKNVQPYCKSLGLSEILVCCLDTNEGSRRTILKNGGRFDGTAYRADENKTLERYWITL